MVPSVIACNPGPDRARQAKTITPPPTCYLFLTVIYSSHFHQNVPHIFPAAGSLVYMTSTKSRCVTRDGVFSEQRFCSGDWDRQLFFLEGRPLLQNNEGHGLLLLNQAVRRSQQFSSRINFYSHLSELLKNLISCVNVLWSPNVDASLFLHKRRPLLMLFLLADNIWL